MKAALCRPAAPPTRRSGARGQGLVEFALVLPLLVLVVAGTVEVGRGVYLYNAVSEAVREIARTDSVHACDDGACSLGTADQTTLAISTQRQNVPGLGTPTFTCVDIRGAAVSGSCDRGDWVKVRDTVTFTPLLGLVGTWTLQSASSMEIP